MRENTLDLRGVMEGIARAVVPEAFGFEALPRSELRKAAGETVEILSRMGMDQFSLRLRETVLEAVQKEGKTRSQTGQLETFLTPEEFEKAVDDLLQAFGKYMESSAPGTKFMAAVNLSQSRKRGVSESLGVYGYEKAVRQLQAYLSHLFLGKDETSTALVPTLRTLKIGFGIRDFGQVKPLDPSAKLILGITDGKADGALGQKENPNLFVVGLDFGETKTEILDPRELAYFALLQFLLGFMASASGKSVNELKSGEEAERLLQALTLSYPLPSNLVSHASSGVNFMVDVLNQFLTYYRSELRIQQAA